MREVLNISLPPPTAKLVRSAVKSGHYASTSEFFRALLRDWQEGQLLVEIRESQKEIASGKGKKLTSFKDLR